MKSWIHEISESYVEKRRPARKDLLEHYRKLDEQQKFDLMKYNMMVYLDEQVRNAYGVSLDELNEEQLEELFGGLMGGIGGIAGAGMRGFEKVKSAVGRGAERVKSAVAKPLKAGLDYYGAGEEARGEVAAERGREIQAAETVGGKLRAVTPRGKGAMAALRAGYRKGLGGKPTDGTEETPAAETAPETTSRITVGDDESSTPGTVTATGRTRTGSVQLGASGGEVSLRRPAPATPSADTPDTTKPEDKVTDTKTKETPKTAPTKMQDISIDLPSQPFKAPRLAPGSVTLGPDGETKSTSGQYMSKAAVEAGAQLKQTPFTRRRRDVKIAGKDV
jgi:hypothetical protein